MPGRWWGGGGSVGSGVYGLDPGGGVEDACREECRGGRVKEGFNQTKGVIQAL